MSPFSKIHIFDWSIIGGIQYIILTIIAMIIYPGSTRFNHDVDYYIFSENLLSDLGRIMTFAGAANYYSAALYMFTLSFVGFSSILLFAFFPKVLDRGNKWTKLFSNLMRISGIISGLGFMGIAFAPSDLLYKFHMLSVLIAFAGLLHTLFFLMLCIYRTKHYPNLYANLLLLTFLLLLGYMHLITMGPHPRHSHEGLVIQVLGQKVIVYMLIISLSLQAFGAKKIWFKLGLE